MISLRARIIRGLLSAAVQQRGKGDHLYGLPDPAAAKPEPPCAPPKGYRWQREAVGSAHVEALRGPRADAVIFNVHGGGFTQGLTNARRKMAEAYSRAAGGATVISADYRVSPEVVHPAGLEDCLACWTWMEEQGIDPARVVVVSDSAGGNLAFAMLLTLRDRGQTLPKAIFSMSPLLDCAMKGASHGFNLYRDPMFGKPKRWLPKEPVPDRRLYYAGKWDVYDPYLSPIYGDLRGLPPMLLQTGTWEILLSDTVDFVAKAKAAGVDARASLYDGMPHIFQCMYDRIPESKKAWCEIADFLQSYLT